jgi:hypothetical protein
MLNYYIKQSCVCQGFFGKILNKKMASFFSDRIVTSALLIALRFFYFFPSFCLTKRYRYVKVSLKSGEVVHRKTIFGDSI